MSFNSALLQAWNDSAASFASAGYAFFNVEAHVVCTVVLVILFLHQYNSSDQTEPQVIWSRLLFIQILYCLSGVFRVLVDINIIPKSNLSQYIVTAANFGLFGCLCWLTFVYIEIYQKSGLLTSLQHKIYSAIPFIFNVINLVSSPFTGSFIDISGASMKNGIFFPLMVTINLSYPTIAVILAMLRRSRMTRYERDTISIMAIYPAFFMVCGPLQALNWRIPFLCYAIMISDIFVYINYSDSLVSVDPLTKIANRNGFIRTLSDKLASGDTESLYLFAVDVDDLGSINSSYGRPEGDKALILIANALKKLRDEEHPCQIARYHGDEFALMADITDKEELELFVEHIRNYISNAVIANNLPYLIRVSIGYSHYEQYSRTETISGLIDEADRMLEEQKEQHKLQNIWGTRIGG